MYLKITTIHNDNLEGLANIGYYEFGEEEVSCIRIQVAETIFAIIPLRDIKTISIDGYEFQRSND